MADEAVDDDYNPEGLLDGDDEERQPDRGVWSSSKERILALVDADAAMLQPLVDSDEERPYLGWALHMLCGIMQERIRVAPSDELGVAFYGTVERSAGAGNERSFEHVYEWLPLDAPTAASIRTVADFDVASFRQSPGCTDASTAPPGQAGEDLKHGLWAAWDIFQRQGGSAALRLRTSLTLLVFTNNQDPLAGAPNPGHLREQIEQRMQELGGLEVKITVVPLIQLQSPAAFSYRPFWAPLLAEARAQMALVLGAAAGDEAADAEAAAAEEDDIEGKVLRVRSLGLRPSGVRKRHLNMLTWRLAPGLEIAVKLYGLVMPAKKPSATYVTAATNEEVSKSHQRVDVDAGFLVSKALKHVVFAPVKPTTSSASADGGGGGGSARFPEVVVTKDDASALRSLRPKGLVLLGFKPASCLRDYHTLGPSRFVYPDEWSAKGSTAAFAALHAACLNTVPGEPQMAVCSYVSRAGGPPTLAALLPQPEELDGDEQVVPPGFHLIALPFRDDLRTPERDPTLLARVATATPGAPRADNNQVAAAAALVNALSLDGVDEDGEPLGFHSEEIGNAALERHFQVLEALALGEEVPPAEELEDETTPDFAGIQNHEPTIEAFSVAVYNSIDGPPTKAAAVGSKRKAADPSTQAAAAEEYAQHNWAALAAGSGQSGLEGLTIKTLKVFCTHHDLRVSGTKPQLIERIKQHLAGGT